MKNPETDMKNYISFVLKVLRSIFLQKGGRCMVENVVTKLEKLNLTDRFLFDETMEDKDAYQATVSILLEKETTLINRPETEKELRVSPQLRQVRLDVVSMDSEKTLYYTEMQKWDTGNLKKRSRYYQAQLDVSLLEPGNKDFNLLNDSCFILIAPFDLYGRGLYRYTFEGTCRECPDLKIGDGAVRVFINTKGKNRQFFSQEFLDFMDYITESTDDTADRTKSARIRLIHDRVRKIRKSEKMGVKYMQFWEEKAYAREEGLEEGRAEGLAKGMVEGRAEGIVTGGNMKLIQLVCRMLQRGNTPEKIADDFAENIDYIKAIYQAAEECSYDCDKIYAKVSGVTGM